MTIIVPIIAVTVIGLACAVMLSVASVVMEVKVDERITKVRECLPGANCGACGYTGCDGYAAALVEDGAKTNLCIPGADATAKAVADVLGVEAEDVVEQVAFVACRGNCGNTHRKYEYQGIETCAAAKILYGGDGSCIYGCLGHGDCTAVCPNNAIKVIDEIAVIDHSLCSGCGMCAKTCPNGVIRMITDVSRVYVGCQNTEKGAVARKHCTAACIACKKCEKECPVGAIKVENNLAVIDYSLCTHCGHCAEVCTTQCIAVADLTGIHKA